MIAIAQNQFSTPGRKDAGVVVQRDPTAVLNTLAEVLGIHPLTLLMLSYLDDRHTKTADELMALVAKELHLVLGAKKSGKADT